MDMLYDLETPSVLQLIDEISLQSSGFEVHVNVMKMWKVWNPDRVVSVEMVFVDRAGSRIHASIGEGLVDLFEDVILEGMTYVIRDILLVTNNDLTRTSDTSFKMVFGKLTSVVICNGFSLALVSRKFESFRHIFDGVSSNEVLIDVVGQVVAVGNLARVSRKGVRDDWLEIVIRDVIGLNLTCVLWGCLGRMVTDYIEKHISSDIVCVIRLARLDKHRGVRCISNVPGATHVLFNPPEDQIGEFRSFLPKDGLLIVRDVDRQASTAFTKSWQDELFTMHNRKTIKEIVHSREVGKCVTLASAVAVINTTSCFYFQCNICDMEVIPTGFLCGFRSGSALFHCENCCVDITNVTARFMLELLMRDESGSEAKFLLLDELVALLIEKTADEVLAAIVNDGGPVLSATLGGLLGKELLSKIDIAEVNLHYKNAPFMVNIVTCDGGMIDKFHAFGESQRVSISYDERGFEGFGEA